MQQDAGTGLQYTYESSATSSWLVIVPEEGSALFHYQTEMLSSNPVRGVLPLNLREKSGNTCLYYNITSKLSLAQHLRRKKLERKEMLRLLTEITYVLIEGTKYLLYDSSFILSEDFIYADPGRYDVFLAYIPCKTGWDTRARLKELVVRLIMSTAGLDGESGDNALQRILVYMGDEAFCLKGLAGLLKELELGGRAEQIEETVLQTPPLPEPHRKEKEKEKEEPESLQFIPNPGKRPARSRLLSISMPGEPWTVEKPQQEKKGKSWDRLIPSQFSSKTWLFCLTTQLGMLLLLAMVSHYIRASGKGSLTTYLAVGLVVAAVDVLVFKNLFGAKKSCGEVESGKPAMDREKAETEKPENRAKEEELETVQNYVPEYPPVSAVEEKAPFTSKQDTAYETGGLTGNATEMLDSIQPKQPYLEGRGKESERIYISRESFIIGRLDSWVDHCIKNNAVGKMHAEIFTSEGQWFLRDLNSRNGTYLNGKKLECSREYPMESGARIIFANSDYVFVVPPEWRYPAS